MRLAICTVALFSALAFVAPVSAQEAAPAAAPAPAVAVKAGSLLKTSDGKRVGRIERVIAGKDGTPVSASVIFDSRFVYVPYSTISATDAGVVTSLSYAEVRKLK